MRRARAKRHGTDLRGAQLDVLLFPRDEWSLRDAQLWARLNGYKWHKHTVTSNYIRLVQTRATGKAPEAKVIRWAAGGVRAAVAWR